MNLLATQEAFSAPLNFQPHDYQTQAIKLMIKQAAAGLLCWPGAGKTACVLAAYKILRTKGFVKRVLVIAPLKPCYLVWPPEAQKWQQFKDISVAVIHGTPAERQAALEEQADFSVINPEGLEWLIKQKDALKAFDMLVVDESSKFKSTKTRRFKYLKSILGNFKRRYILTGTPAPNGLLDLFGQIYALDTGVALGRYITHYRLQYFEPSGWGGYEWKIRKWEDEYGVEHTAAEEIYEKIRPLVLRPDDTEYRKSLPPLMTVDLPVVLPPEARKIYDMLEGQLIVALENSEVRAVNEAVVSMKLRQVASGAVYAQQLSEDGLPIEQQYREVVDIHNEKIEAVKDLVDELEGQPAFIAYEFQHELARLQKALSNPPYLAGGITMKQAVATAKAWNAGELPVLLVQPQSVAHGLNLQGAGRAIIWYSLTWNQEEYEQLIQRIWRQGKVGSLFNYRLIAQQTVDEIMVAALARKTKVQNALLEALKTQRRNRRMG